MCDHKKIEVVYSQKRGYVEEYCQTCGKFLKENPFMEDEIKEKYKLKYIKLTSTLERYNNDRYFSEPSNTTSMY
jgi:hypothetical protein